MTTVFTLWHHRGPCSMKNLLSSAFERPGNMERTWPLSLLTTTVT